MHYNSKLKAMSNELKVKTPIAEKPLAGGGISLPLDSVSDNGMIRPANGFFCSLLIAWCLS
jgi:hypothetical protein